MCRVLSGNRWACALAASLLPELAERLLKVIVIDAGLKAAG
jgi:hypothetical protein